jgi:alpha-amylase
VRNLSKKITSIVLVICMMLSCLAVGSFSAQAATTEAETVSADYGLADNIQDGVILHCFDWKYNDIKAELPNIAKAGFTAIQTSPVQPHDTTGTWYWAYLPRGFYVGSNEFGTKADLQALCTEADNYGIKVVVDVVANHLTGDHSKIQDDLKAGQYWHNYGTVSNWGDRYQVTHGEIGMPDLNTEHSYVQQVVANYVKELKSIGVDGIRWDAAKHIGLPSEGDNFWKSVTKEGLWNYGEILGGPADGDHPALMKEYTNYISVTDDAYGRDIRDSIKNGSVPASHANWGARGIAADKIVYCPETHDTWSNGNDWGYSHGHSQNVIDRTYALLASRAGATALYFSRPHTADKESIKMGVKGSTHFTSKEVAEVNKFHNAMIGQKEYFVS